MDEAGKVGTITYAILILGLVAAVVVTKLGGEVVFATIAAFAVSATISIALRGAIGRWLDEVVRPNEEFLLAYSEQMTHVPKRVVFVVLLAIAFGIGGALLNIFFPLVVAGAFLGTSIFPFVVKSAVESGTN